MHSVASTNMEYDGQVVMLEVCWPLNWPSVQMAV